MPPHAQLGIQSQPQLRQRVRDAHTNSPNAPPARGAKFAVGASALVASSQPPAPGLSKKPSDPGSCRASLNYELSLSWARLVEALERATTTVACHRLSTFWSPTRTRFLAVWEAALADEACDPSNSVSLCHQATEKPSRSFLSSQRLQFPPASVRPSAVRQASRGTER